MSDVKKEEAVMAALKSCVLWRDMDGAGTLETYGVSDDQIRKLAQAALTTASAEIEALRERARHAENGWTIAVCDNSALRAALEPFAGLADAAEAAAVGNPLMGDGVHDEDYTTVTIGLCRAARAALTKGPTDER